MLDKSVLPDSSYTMNYFTKELIHIPDALISTLINGPLAVAQALGAKLLASYIHAQDNVENQVTAVDQLMQSVLGQMLGRLDLSAHRPNDMQAGSGDHSQNAAWIGRMQEDCKAAWMLCIQEYILLCHRLNIVPDYLEEVVECILENLDLSSRGVQEILMQQTTFSALGITGILLSDAADLALMSFRCLQPFVHDMSSTYRVLETVMRYLDRDGRWGSEHVVVNLLGLIRHACGDHTFPLFTTLLRHCSAEGLTTQQRKIIVSYASQWGSTHSLSAISHALTELPKALAAADMKPQTANQPLLRTPDQILLLEEVIATMRTLALNVGNVDELCDALAGALRRHASSSTMTPVSAMAVECCLAALNVIPEFPHQGRTFSHKGFPSLLIQQLGPYLVGAAACEDQFELEVGVRRSSLCCLLCILPLAILGAGVQAKPNSFNLAEMPTQSSHHTGYTLGSNHSSFSHTSTASRLQANLSSHDQHNGDLHRSSDALFQAAGSTVKSASSITCGSQPQTSPEGITSSQLDSRLCSQSMVSTDLLSSAPLPHTPLAPELSDGVVTCAPDERTALSLLSMACALACEGAAGPKELEGASWLTAAAATCLSPHVQLQLARLLLALRGMFLLKETSSWSSVRVSGGLLLAECMLQQLRLSARCTLLSQLLVPGQVLEQPELKFVWNHRSDVLNTSLGVGSRELVIPVLSAKCERFEATPGAESKARVGVKVLLSGAVAWADAFVTALQAEGLLHRAYGESLSKHMSEAFNTNAFSAPLLRTMATPSTPLPSYVSAAEAAAGSSPAASIMVAETSRQQKHYSIQGSKGGDSATSMSATLPPSLAVTRGAAAGSDELRLLMPGEADPGSVLQSALTETQQSSSAISVVMSPVDLLPQRVKAAAWGGRQASWTGREQMIGGPATALNLTQVLEILEEEQQQQQSLGPRRSSETVAVKAEDDDVGTSLQYSASSANRYPACFTYDQKDNTMLKSRGGAHFSTHLSGPRSESPVLLPIPGLQSKVPAKTMRALRCCCCVGKGW
ncbi:hypothetical protein CEUSTIGMA_g343.t1 [Chlamydomonas eustigma]|uniref:Uncharacterized protein n=1 Tax=Chlamydomonas eustigma TaxID=1157962 RepID=A0A250WPY3_9CHLO|nr:hypothetical protein CEUSTIGMA_g343.t1 [Chlamydomonas eustigma]|eukprot:GAX72888.1 hypothetical protein CEUSTIGMA_g343.t1 [Chlamydomonas eustigma]